MTRFRRRVLADVTAYVPGEQPKPGGPVKLNTNENPYPPSPDVFRTLAALDADALRRYPDPLWTDLRQAAAEVYDIPSEQIAVGNGSDELLRLILNAFVDLDDTVVFPDITYSLYETLVALHGARTALVPLNADFSMPESLGATPGKVLFICHPNSPTGMPVEPRVVERAVAEFQGIVVLDEAYADFCEYDYMNLAGAHDNVLVLRTLSKSYSLCGMRTGLALGHPDLIRWLETVKDSYNVGVASQTAATAALRDQAHMRKNRDLIIATRDRFANALRESGIDVLPSAANFVFARFASPEKAKHVFTHLRDAGWLVRYFNRPRLTDGLRISIGTDEQMDCVMEVVRQAAV